MDDRMGKRGRDRITGFEGVIVGMAHYLFGCTQLGLAPPVKDGKLENTHWFDEGRVEIIGTGVTAAAVTAEQPGGPNRDAPR